MIANNIKTQLFYFHSVSLSVQEISFILNIFYVYHPIELKFSMSANNIKMQLKKKYVIYNSKVIKGHKMSLQTFV